jgi:tryptophanyl-tRNA synthetase
MKQKRLVSGLQPSGELHLGNYLGAIKQMVALQDDYESYVFIADYHALTTRPAPAELKKNTLHITAMLVALGIDPKSTILFRQSDLPEHTELGWILNNFTTIGELSRMTQYKEKSNRHGQNVGLFTYPALMAADILLYDAEVVPVGDDQVQHLEIAREIARTVNTHTGKDTVVEPKPLLTKASRIMALNDPARKMSKSIPGSSIGLLDEEAEIIRNIKRAVTDSDPNSSEMSQALKNLFTILEGVSDPQTVQKFEKMYREGNLRYSELKEQLTEDILSFLKPVQKAYASLIAEPDQIKKILSAGKNKAQPIAQETLSRIKADLGFTL